MEAPKSLKFPVCLHKENQSSNHKIRPIHTSPQGYKTLCSTQLSMKFIMLINVKMPTICWHFNIYQHDKYNCLITTKSLFLKHFRFLFVAALWSPEGKGLTSWLCDFVTLPFGILGQVWYLIVLISDPCCLSYFYGQLKFHAQLS